MAKDKIPYPFRALLEERASALTEEEAAGLIRESMSLLTKHGPKNAERLQKAYSRLQLYKHGPDLPVMELSTVQELSTQVMPTKILGIHCSPTEPIADPTRFARETKGITWGASIQERVEGSHAEWKTAQRDRHNVVCFSNTLGNLLYTGADWRRSPDRKHGRSPRGYISSARVIDLETPDAFPTSKLPAYGVPFRVDLQRITSPRPDSPEGQLATYLAEHARVREHKQQPIDKLE